MVQNNSQDDYCLSKASLPSIFTMTNIICILGYCDIWYKKVIGTNERGSIFTQHSFIHEERLKLQENEWSLVDLP